MSTLAVHHLGWWTERNSQMQPCGSLNNNLLLCLFHEMLWIYYPNAKLNRITNWLKAVHEINYMAREDLLRLWFFCVRVLLSVLDMFRVFWDTLQMWFRQRKYAACTAFEVSETKWKRERGRLVRFVIDMLAEAVLTWVLLFWTVQNVAVTFIRFSFI